MQRYTVTTAAWSLYFYAKVVLRLSSWPNTTDAGEGGCGYVPQPWSAIVLEMTLLKTVCLKRNKKWEGIKISKLVCDLNIYGT
jgi:hypothetical protein